MITLLEDVKSELHITWTDEDDELVRLLERGSKTLDRLIGAALDYTAEDEAQSLLFAYVRYSRNKALEYFRENFRDDITSLSLMHGAAAMAEEADA